MLYDPYGRELKSPPTKPALDMLGTVLVRDQYSSYPTSRLTPEKLAAIWREADAGSILHQAEAAEEMEEKDPDLSSLLHTRKLAVQGLDLEVTPASDWAEDKKIADHVRTNLQDLELDGATLDLLDAIFKGFGTVEIHWDLQGSNAWVSGLEWIPQHRFTFVDWTGGGDPYRPLPKLPRLLTAEEPIAGIEVPAFKIIYHRHKARSGLAQRGGLFRPCSYYYVFKNWDIKDWVVFLEKFGSPLRLGKFSAGAGREEIEILKQAVRDLGTDAGAVISDTTMLEILEAKGITASSDLYERLASFVNKSWAKCILGQTATTEGTPGKLGAEVERSEVRHDLVVSDAKALAKTLKAQLVWPMVGFNFGWDKMLPDLQFPVEEPEERQALATTHKTLVEIGMPIPVSFAQKKYGIPAPQGDEPILGLQPGSSPGFPPGTGLAARMAALAKKKVSVPIGSRRVEFTA